MVSEVKEMQENGITLLATPITIDIGDWVINNIGKVAVAKKHPDNTATIYAVEKGDSAPPQMVKYAKENDAMILVGISEGEVNAID